jgi:hypothetical protein
MRHPSATALWTGLVHSATQAAAQDEARWVEVFSDADEVVSIDTASVTSLGNETYRIWERSAARASGEVRILARADFDCRLRLTRAAAIALPGLAPLRALAEEREWTEILPGTRFEAELRQVCAAGRRSGGPSSP